MRITSILENQKIEKRIAITPEIAKKYISLGFEVSLSENYGNHLGIKDEEYKELGVSISKDEKEIISSADIIVQLGLLDDDKSSLFKENQSFIGVLNPYENKDKINDLVKKNINTFSLELLPRITRAQSMDILSSQANLAGYKAVVESFAHFEKAIPMMMTAAGTIPAAKVLVVGAGVAGLQAIATAKRMGAIVFATDVRLASKEQVESLGGKFLTVEGAENLETEGGYAKEASDDFKKKQEELLSETLKKIDIVVCTALIPGKKAPIIIKEDMINNMKAGSIIYDLAAIQGGNTAHTKVDEIVDKNGVKIMGESNILNKLPTSASNLYAKNVFNFVSNLYDKENITLFKSLLRQELNAAGLIINATLNLSLSHTEANIIQETMIRFKIAIDKLSEHIQIKDPQKSIKRRSHETYILSKTMRIRLAKKSDIWLLYNWVNKIDSIENKLITNKKIPKTDHKIWYENSLKNKNRYIWIIENQHIAIGQLRFDINEDKKLCFIDIYIDKEHRKNNFGQNAYKSSY